MNAAGNVTSERRRDGQLVAITYDDLSRRSFRDAPGTASDVTYAYDNRGLQTAASVPGHASAYAFDAFGRRTQQTHDGAMPVSYAYDAASRLTRLTHPDGFAVDYAYDAAGAVISAVNGATTIATVAYDALGRRAALTYGNGAVATYGYDAASRLDALDWDVAGSADDIAYGFSYNPASQTRTKNVAPAVMLWTPPSNATDTYAVNGLNQYTDVKGNTIVHDGRGNITTDHRGRTQTYDIDNRLLTVAGLAGGTATYAYTASGNLHQKSYSGVTSKFYYDDTQEIYETDGVGVKLRRYLRLPGSTDEPLLMIDYTLNGSCTNTSYAACEVWAHQNRQGSIVATTNSTGAKLDLYTYSPYGESGTEGASGFPFRYTGQKLDPDTGLYYYKARWYDPEPGRFMQTDPIGYEDQMNLYAYVSNDPVNATDPTGECPWCIGAIVGAIAGAVVETVVQTFDDIEGYQVGKISISAAVGAASGALGPAGGAAIRTAIVGKASAATVAQTVKSGTATTAVKGFAALTDTVADLAGQPALGAAVAALKGDDPVKAAVASEGAALLGAGESAASLKSSVPKSSTRAGFARAGIAAARQVGSNVAKTIAKNQAANAATEGLVEEKED